MNKEEKPKVICIFGFMATGKLTIGQKLHEKIGINFSHNHLLNDFVGSMFPRGTKERPELIERLRLQTLKQVVSTNNSLIITHAYSSNFISSTGISDLEYVKKMEEVVISNYGTFYGIHLIAENKIVLERVSNKSRTLFKKLTDAAEAEDILNKTGEQKSPDLKKLLKINTGNNTVDESVDKIINFITERK